MESAPELENGNERIFQPRDIVKVERTGGGREDGWMVLAVLESEGRVTVINPGGVTKNPTIEDLRKWNQ